MRIRFYPRVSIRSIASTETHEHHPWCRSFRNCAARWLQRNVAFLPVDLRLRSSSRLRSKLAELEIDLVRSEGRHHAPYVEVATWSCGIDDCFHQLLQNSDSGRSRYAASAQRSGSPVFRLPSTTTNTTRASNPTACIREVALISQRQLNDGWKATSQFIVSPSEAISCVLEL